MPSVGDGVAWDETIPTDSGEIDDTGTEMREIKKAVRIRLNKEHVDLAAASAGGEHEKGSAKAYYQGSYPTLRPDGTTTLDSNDSGRILVRSDGPWLEVFDGANFQKLQPPDGSLTAAKFADGAIYNAINHAVYVESIAAGTTTTGDFNSGAWRTRNLTTEEFDAAGIGSLSANQVTLGAGTYRLRASAPALEVNYHQVRIRNVTDGTTVGLGDMALSGQSDTTVTRSEATCEITLTGSRAFEVQHRCSDSRASVGFGASAGTFGVAWYTTRLEITKLK